MRALSSFSAIRSASIVASTLFAFKATLGLIGFGWEDGSIAQLIFLLLAALLLGFFGLLGLLGSAGQDNGLRLLVYRLMGACFLAIAAFAAWMLLTGIGNAELMA